MTDEGISRIKLRGYQKKMLRDFQDNRFNVMVASRQIGKCFSYSTKIKVKFKNQEIKEISTGNLYFQLLSKERKLTFAEKIKWNLWKFYDWLN
jgi:glutathione peroxidase-family protein